MLPTGGMEALLSEDTAVTRPLNRGHTGPPHAPQLSAEDTEGLVTEGLPMQGPEGRTASPMSSRVWGTRRRFCGSEGGACPPQLKRSPRQLVVTNIITSHETQPKGLTFEKETALTEAPRITENPGQDGLTGTRTTKVAGRSSLGNVQVQS